MRISIPLIGLFFGIWVLTSCGKSTGDQKKVEEEIFTKIEIEDNIDEKTTDTRHFADSVNTKKSDNPAESSREPKPRLASQTQKKKPFANPVPTIERPSGPMITFDRMNHSFGELVSGDLYEHKFEFTNTGGSDLIIEEVKVSCGCTQPSYPFVPIAPGEQGYIGITYNSVGKSGLQRPKVTVYTNGEPSIFNLYLEGEVLEKSADTLRN